MNCIFLRRGYPEVSNGIESPAALFADAVRIAAAGSNSSTTGSVSLSVSKYTSGLYYAFSFCNGYMSIYRFLDGVLTPLFQSSTSNGNLCLSGTNLEYSPNGQNQQRVYGAEIVLLQFPSYSQEELDAVFTSCSLVSRAGRNASSTSSVYVPTSNANGHPFVFAVCYYAYQACMGVHSYMDGSGISPIFTTSGAAHGFLWLSGRYYYLSTSGTSSVSVYGGSIVVLDCAYFS